MLLSVIIVGVLLKNSEIGNTLIFISFNLLAILYFFMAFSIVKPANDTTIFLNKLIQLSFSLAALAVLFKFKHYTSAEIMLRVSMVSMFIGFIFSMINRFKYNKNSPFMDANIIRIVIFTLLITTLITTNKFEFSQAKNIDTQEITKDKNIP